MGWVLGRCLGGSQYGMSEIASASTPEGEGLHGRESKDSLMRTIVTTV